MPGRCCSGTHVAVGRRGRALSRRTARPRWHSSACVELGRSTSISFQASAPEILAIPPRSGSEITEIPPRPGRSSCGCRASSRRDAVRRPRTDRTRPSPSDVSTGSSTAAGRSHQLVADPEDPSSPVSRAVHRVAHCGAIFCGYRLQAPTRLPGHGRERHSYTACGWSCPQSSTGLLWEFTCAECRRRRWTTGSRVSRQILTTSWFPPETCGRRPSYTPCGRLTQTGSVHSSVDSCGRRPSRCGRGTLDRWTTCGDRLAAHRRRDFPTLGSPVRPHAFVPSDLDGHRFSTRSTTPMTTTRVFSEGKFHTPSSGSGGRRCDLCSTSLLPILVEPRRARDVGGDRRRASVPRPAVPVPPTRLLA